jgi:hypothetical protein
MILDTLHLDDYGDTIKVPIPEDTDIPTDLGSSVLEIRYTKPSGDSGSWSADLSEDESSAEYETVEGDIDEVGVWQIQLKITDSFIQYGDILFLKVLSNTPEAE